MLMSDPNTNDLLTEVVGDDRNDDKRKVVITEDDGLDYEDEILSLDFLFLIHYNKQVINQSNDAYFKVQERHKHPSGCCQ